MIGLIFYVCTAVLLLLAAVVLLFRGHKPAKRDNLTLTVDDFLAVHHREFEEVERRLARYEAMVQEILGQRPTTAFAYLKTLRADFTRVEALLNHSAKFLPELTARGEWERFWICLKFQSECHLARVQVLLGVIPAGRLTRMTRRVRVLAERADQALNAISREHGIRILQSDLNA